ncbi:MAG: hypothetical protein IPO93_16585 [Actinobacteria bacterium]|nr:hypothetical protein [Actinomycetota bacterium]
MTDTHLNNHHRDTLSALFAHPTSHNIRWVDIVSLVGAVGEVEEKHDGRFRLTVGSESEVFDRTHGKDVTMEQITDLRRMLSHAGYGASAGKPPGAED